MVEDIQYDAELVGPEGALDAGPFSSPEFTESSSRSKQSNSLNGWIEIPALAQIDDSNAPISLPAFCDSSLLRRALTHRSYVNEHPELALEDNERLEFLGDAVLDFVSAAWLYNRFPEADEGRMTSLRAALVKTEMLAGFSVRLSLAGEISLGKGESESGGRKRVNLLADAFEAVVGALYLDQGLETVRLLVEPLFTLTIDYIIVSELDRDPKSVLQEWSQAERSQTPRYRTVKAEGPDHAKIFTVDVYIGSEAVGQGEGSSKQAATQAAAENAIERLEIVWPARPLNQATQK